MLFGEYTANIYEADTDTWNAIDIPNPPQVISRAPLTLNPEPHVVVIYSGS